VVDTSALEAAFESLLREVTVSAHERGSAAEPDGWDTTAVVAHVIASNRMVAAACAELMSGRVPVADNRPTQSEAYLGAIIASADGLEGLVTALAGSAREVAILAGQLDQDRAETLVPTIIVDGGRYRVERPVAFSALLAPAHVLEHRDQIAALNSRGATKEEETS